MSYRAQRLRNLADAIDHEELWKRPLMERDKLTNDQRARLDAGVMLRRYSDILAPGRWLLIPPSGVLQFSAGSLEKVAAMAAEHYAARACAHCKRLPGDPDGCCDWMECPVGPAP